MIKHQNIPVELQINNYQRALVLIPHPDDEALGCGGLLALLAKTNCDVHVILVTDGAGGDVGNAEQAFIRQKEFVKALTILGLNQEPDMWKFPDGKISTHGGLAQAIEAAIELHAPSVVIAPWYNDWHSDHKAIGLAVRKLCKKGRFECLYFEVWSPLKPTHIIDISNCIEIKRKAIECHATAMRHGNFDEALIGLNAYRSLFLPRYNQRPIYAEAYELQLPGRSKLRNLIFKIFKTFNFMFANLTMKI